MPDNAIYHLARALARLGDFNFPFKLSDVTRAYFEQSAKLESGQLAADLAAVAVGSEDAMLRVAAASPNFAAMMRTTCVATMLDGGHAVNALPQRAAANVNCRILPEDSIENVFATLKNVVAGEQVEVRIKTDAGKSPASPSDALYLRGDGIPTYGLSGLFSERNDPRAHGRDERRLVSSFYEGQTFMYEIVKLLSNGN